MRGIELGKKKALNTVVLGLKSVSKHSDWYHCIFLTPGNLVEASLFDCSSHSRHSPQRALFPIALLKCIYKSTLWEMSLVYIEKQCVNGKQLFETFQLTSNLSYKAAKESSVFIQCLKYKIIDLLTWLL